MQWVLILGGDDIEDDVPGREQVVSERESRSGREKEKRRQKKRRQQTLKHVTSRMACRWSDCAPETP